MSESALMSQSCALVSETPDVCSCVKIIAAHDVTGMIEQSGELIELSKKASLTRGIEKESERGRIIDPVMRLLR